MTYKLLETREAVSDITGTANYLAGGLKNKKTAMDFLDRYDQEIKKHARIPFAYRETGLGAYPAKRERVDKRIR